MAIRSSIYLNDELEQFLNIFNGLDKSKSLSFAYFISLSKAFIKAGAQEALTKLEIEDWGLILQAYNGHVTSQHDIKWEVRAGHLASIVCSDLGIDNILEVKGDVRKQIERILNLTVTQQMAAIVVSRMYWANKTKYNTLKDTLVGLVDKL